MNPSDPVTVVIDDRESSSGIAEILQQRHGVEVRIQRLSLGDYLVDDVVLLERKTFPDLVASIKDGRLFGQGCRLAGAPHWAAVVLEGTSRDLTDCDMRREAIQGALITLTLFLGIPLLRSQHREETARLMLYAARQGRLVATGALPRRGRRPRGKSRVQSRVLQGLPGIGPERARRLLERFGSLEAVLTADVEALASVEGIGSSTAKAIRWAVEEGAPAYGSDRDWLVPV